MTGCLKGAVNVFCLRSNADHFRNDCEDINVEIDVSLTDFKCQFKLVRVFLILINFQR